MIPQVIINEIFGYRLSYFPVGEIELLAAPPWIIYLIDLDNAFYDGVSDDEAGLININELKEAEINFRQPYAFLKHIAGLNNELLIKYVKKAMEDDKKQLEADYFLRLFLKRKAGLLEYVLKRYSPHPCFSKRSLALAGSFSYRLNICKDLSKDIIQKAVSLLFLKKQIPKREIEAITSIKVHNYFDEYGEWEDVLGKTMDVELGTREGKVPDEEIKKIFSKLGKGLIALRLNCFDPKEKLAATIYLRQVRILAKYTLENNIDHEGGIFTWIVQNIDKFAHPYSTDYWLNFAEYAKDGKVRVVSVEGEDEYIAGLINLLHRQYPEAVRFLSSAQRKGYAVEEIKSILKDIKKDVK